MQVLLKWTSALYLFPNFFVHTGQVMMDDDWSRMFFFALEYALFVSLFSPFKSDGASTFTPDCLQQKTLTMAYFE